MSKASNETSRGTDLEAPDEAAVTGEAAPSGSAAGTVAAGIFTSRLLGFVRERAVAHFFGVGAHSDVFQVAFRGPNLLQNLLGEGTISAAFIPIYSRMIEEGRAQEAGRFAGAIFGLLVAVAAALSLLGFLLAEPIVTVFTPGFLDDAERVAAGELSINRFRLAVQAVKIIFPMTGVLVLSAWCLGVLNSHRKFFLPYFAPVLWNAAIIGGLIFGAMAVMEPGTTIWNPGALATGELNQLLFAAFYGALLGGVLQFLIQLPLVMRVLKGFRVSISTKIAGVRQALSAFGPVVAGRGVYQLSSYLDMFLASFLVAGAVSSLRFAQMLYVLPVSLFGLSVAASELPELSRFSSEELKSFMRRMNRSLRQMLFMTVPTLIGYILFGYLIVGAIFRTGEFGQNDLWLVYLVLGGYSLGLLATTMSRLLQNAFYALGDTRTPAKIAVVRVVVSSLAAVPLMFFLDQFAVSDLIGFLPDARVLFLGSVGLALGATLGAWLELWQLERSLRSRVPVLHLPWKRVGGLTGTALIAAAVAAGVWWLLPDWHVAAEASLVVAVYAGVYLGISALRKAPEIGAWTGRMFG